MLDQPARGGGPAPLLVLQNAERPVVMIDLDPHRPLEVYPELVEAAGGTAPIVERARKQLAAGELHKAQLLIEVARSAAPKDPAVIAAEIEILEALLANARATTNTFSEVGWLQSEIARAKRRGGEGS